MRNFILSKKIFRRLLCYFFEVRYFFFTKLILIFTFVIFFVALLWRTLFTFTIHLNSKYRCAPKCEIVVLLNYMLACRCFLSLICKDNLPAASNRYFGGQVWSEFRRTMWTSISQKSKLHSWVAVEPSSRTPISSPKGP